MKTFKRFNPDELCQESGQYAILNLAGDRVGKEIPLKAGDKFPQRPEGQIYILTQSEAEAELISLRERVTAIDRKVLSGALVTAYVKSGFTILFSVVLFAMGSLIVWRLVENILDPRAWEEIRRVLDEVRRVLPLLTEDNLQSLSEFGLAEIAGALVVIATGVMLRFVVPAILGPLLMWGGTILLKRQVIEDEMTDLGAVVERIRSGMGEVKPVERMLTSVFGRSRSAWELRLWAARVTFFVGLLILALAVSQVFFPGIFPDVDKAVAFTGGAFSSLLSMVVSRWLNPAERMQEGLVHNAEIEVALVSFAKRTSLIESWMAKALLSLKPDDDWGPENKVLQSLQSNSDLIGASLEQTMSYMKLYGTPASQLDDDGKALVNAALRAQALSGAFEAFPTRVFLEFGKRQVFAVSPGYSVKWQIADPEAGKGLLEQPVEGNQVTYVAPKEGESKPGTQVTIVAVDALCESRRAEALVALVKWFKITGAGELKFGEQETYQTEPVVGVKWKVFSDDLKEPGKITSDGVYTPPEKPEDIETAKVVIQASLSDVPDFVRTRMVNLTA